MSIRSWAEQAEPTLEAFKIQFAETLFAWQNVEGAAFILYRNLMKPAHINTVSVNWFHIKSFDAKITLLAHCIFFERDAEKKQDWKQIENRLKSASGLRNALVHGVYHVEVGNGEVTPTIQISGNDATAISKSRINQKGRLNPEHVFDIPRMQTMKGNFHSLTQDIVRFATSIGH